MTNVPSLMQPKMVDMETSGKNVFPSCALSGRVIRAVLRTNHDGTESISPDFLFSPDSDRPNLLSMLLNVGAADLSPADSFALGFTTV